MKIYGETHFFRFRQMATDAGVAVWIVVWIRIGVFINDLIQRLAEPGRTIEDAGASFSSTMADIGNRISDLPVVGATLESPFRAASEAGMTLQEAGQGQQDLIQRIAFWLGVLLAVIPIALVLIRYVPGRLSWIKEASAASRLRIDAADLQLFALRAITNRPLHELRRACKDPAAAFAQGDYAPLARFELASLGLTIGEAQSG